MPTPQSDETFDEWIERCMASDEANEDFPDDAQRYAFCVSRWEQQQDNAMTQPKIEHRVRGEVRAEPRQDGEGRKLVGYAALFNTPADIAGMFREQIAPGAFSEAIGRDDVRALVNHDANMVLGRNKANTLRMSEDEKGLRVEIDMPDTQMARDLGVSMERGDINQMSFGFIARQQEWDDDEDPPLRTIRAAELFDVSVVTYPAYEETEVGLRSLQHYRQKHETPTATVSAATRARLRAKSTLASRLAGRSTR
jgi:HK97 family phage prohead protease